MERAPEFTGGIITELIWGGMVPARGFPRARKGGADNATTPNKETTRMSDETTREELDARNELEKDLIETPAETVDAAEEEGEKIAGLKKAMRNAYYIAAKLNRHAGRLTAGQRVRFRAVAEELADIAPEGGDVIVTSDAGDTADEFQACGDAIARHLQAARRTAGLKGEECAEAIQNTEKRLDELKVFEKELKQLRKMADGLGVDITASKRPARKRLATRTLVAETTKQDLVKNLQNIEMKSKGDKTLKMLVDWKEFESRTGFGKMARLGELTVDNVKTLLTCLRGGKESKD